MIFYLSQEYAKAINERIRKIEKQLGEGKADSHERYKELVGKISGLKSALELFNETAKRHGDIDDE